MTRAPTTPAYIPYTPLRYSPSVDLLPDEYSGPASVDSTLPSVVNSQNLPPMDLPRLPDESDLQNNKRMLDEEHSAAQLKRSRTGASSRQSSPWPQLSDDGNSLGQLNMNSKQSSLPQDLRQAGLYVQKPDPSAKKTKYYAVPGGRVPGIYTDYSSVEKQTKQYSGSRQKKFKTEDEAWEYMNENRSYVVIALQRQLQNDSPSPRPPPTHSTVGQNTPTSHAPIRSTVFQPIPSSPPPPYSTYPCEPSQSTEESMLPPAERERAASLSSSTTHSDDYISLDDLLDFVAEPEPTLSAEQKNVVDLVMEGKNVFYTGSAGCGKSTILNAVVRKLKQQEMKSARGLNRPFGGVQVVVTGDLQFFQLPPVRPFSRCIGCGWALKHEWMMQGEAKHTCENRECRYDFWMDGEKWAFKSAAWRECNFAHVNLTEIHRQSDRKFISILQKIRIGILSPTLDYDVEQYLTFKNGTIVENHKKVLLKNKSITEGAVKLFSSVAAVDRENMENMARLPSEPITYKCLDNFDWRNREDESLAKYQKESEDEPGTLQQLSGYRYDSTVTLKDGMRVLLKANFPNLGLVNGSQGTIIGFEPFQEYRLPRKSESGSDIGDSGLRGTHAKYAERQIKEYAEHNQRKAWPIVRFDNRSTKTIFADCSYSEVGEDVKDKPISVISRTQIPLVAAYAITVHKSQGMTLDRVIADLSEVFESSQLYVALSRCRSLEGLTVSALPNRALPGTDPHVQEFFRKYLVKKSLSAC
ncbi:hypothetical protein GMOD_00007106 [Pyrenophora seminiperda CCB06]|uniref:Ribonuclease H1 N-terminal domain-containing protein n=1 Tax=Pyrenophora seminiperda CCB06 TaxID=1302712 RepID=A0A3M7MCH3_9PLEO|nr:hypothetical protein GMOD_00007106 [Pyrenophora seminiperda CCB06]